MKHFILQYRVGINGRIMQGPTLAAKCPANAIANFARSLGDIEGQLTIFATEMKE